MDMHMDKDKVTSFENESVEKKVSQVLLVQFAKAPRLGCVKTRMQPYLTKEQSLSLHKQLVLKTSEQLCQSGVGDIQLFIDGPVTADTITQMTTHSSEEIVIKNQRGKDLGAKMLNAFVESFETYPYVILVGSDCPFIDKAYLNAAVRALSSGYQMVVGPAEDGGYVLIGLAGKAHASLFEGVLWGTDRVFDQTRERVHRLGWSMKILPVLSDIDRPEDLKRFQARLQLEV